MEILTILCGHKHKCGIKIIGTLTLTLKVRLAQAIIDMLCRFESDVLINLRARRVPIFRAVLLAIKLPVIE